MKDSASLALARQKGGESGLTPARMSGTEQGMSLTAELDYAEMVSV
jgi:hypothetical protein